MLSKQPFQRRILIAFVLMTVMVSGLFSLSIVGVVHFIEEHLVSQEMSRELGETLNEDIRQGRPPRLDSSTRFFSSNNPDSVSYTHLDVYKRQVFVCATFLPLPLAGGEMAVPQTLKRATRLFRSIARRDSSWLAALVWLAPAELCRDRSRILTRLRSTSLAT